MAWCRLAFLKFLTSDGLGYRSRYSNFLLAGGLGVWALVGWDLPDLSRLALWPTQTPVQRMPDRFQWSSWVMELTTYSLLVPGSRLGRAVLLPPLCACLACNATALPLCWQQSGMATSEIHWPVCDPHWLLMLPSWLPLPECGLTIAHNYIIFTYIYILSVHQSATDGIGHGTSP